MKVENIYAKLPVLFQNFACTYYGWREKRVRMGAEFKQFYSYLLSTENASRTEIEFYQNEKMSKLIERAYRTVPYYKNLMGDAGLKPSDINTKNSLASLPALRKSDVIAHSTSLLSSDSAVNSLRESKTSGTTGTALNFYTTDEAIAFQWAVWWRHRSRFGFIPGEWHVNFTVRPVVPTNQSNPPFWRIDLARKQVIVSAAHLTSSKVPHIVKYLNRKKIKYFTGSPSQIAQFCSVIEEDGLRLTSKPEVVFTGAENIQELQRKVIESVTGAVITDQYGFSEGAANASRCEYGNYHEDWEFGYLECGDGIKNSDGTVTGKILATGFSNMIFPFIRYEVGDTATWAPDDYKCPCGRESKVIFEICGRNDDYIITPEGNKVMRFGFLFKETTGIYEAQVVQREVGSIVIRYVPSESFKEKDLEHVRSLAKEWVSPKLQVTFEKMETIPRSASGKFRPVISELD